MSRLSCLVRLLCHLVRLVSRLVTCPVVYLDRSPFSPHEADLAVGQLIHVDQFRLFEAMSSTEVAPLPLSFLACCSRHSSLVARRSSLVSRLASLVSRLSSLVLVSRLKGVSLWLTYTPFQGE